MNKRHVASCLMLLLCHPYAHSYYDMRPRRHSPKEREERARLDKAIQDTKESLQKEAQALEEEWKKKKERYPREYARKGQIKGGCLGVAVPLAAALALKCVKTPAALMVTAGLSAVGGIAGMKYGKQYGYRQGTKQVWNESPYVLLYKKYKEIYGFKWRYDNIRHIGIGVGYNYCKDEQGRLIGRHVDHGLENSWRKWKREYQWSHEDYFFYPPEPGKKW